MNRSAKISFLLVPALVYLSMSCAGDGEADPDAIAVEQTIRTMIDAWNRQDGETFASSWTSAAIEERFGTPAQEIREESESYLGEPPRQIREISDVSVRAGSGFARVEIEAGRAVYTDRYILIQQGGDWVIEAADQVEPDLRGGTRMLEVEMRESAFAFDPAEVQDGNLAFQAENLGTQPHELTLWRVPSGFSADEALEEGSSEVPAEVESIGSTGPVAPGGTGWFALIEPLAPGRYVMVCLLQDTSGPGESTHADNGMVGEFEITAASVAPQ